MCNGHCFIITLNLLITKLLYGSFNINKQKVSTLLTMKDGSSKIPVKAYFLSSSWRKLEWRDEITNWDLLFFLIFLIHIFS